MGVGVNICALLLGLAASAGWTLYLCTVPRQRDWINLLGGVGILALVFSIVSPNDDGFQQELIRPAAAPSVTASAHAREALRRSTPALPINEFVDAGVPIRVFMTGCVIAMDRAFELDTHFHSPISIHSPPVAS
jgi:hypothetical protein